MWQEVQIDMDENKVIEADAILDANARIINLYVTCTQSSFKVNLKKR